VSAAPAVAARPAFRVNRSTVGLLVVAALAWVGVIADARHMGNGVGTMGMRILEFVPMWGAMMAAMMLPAVAPVATLYAKTITGNRTARLMLFVAGYLVAWTVTGVPAYYVLRLVDQLVGDGRTVMRVTAAVTLGVAAVYQLSPLKSRCLRHCRSPLGLLLHYGNVKGPARELRVAAHHALYCIGCCWALMALFVAFGVMNVWAMVALTAIVLGEKVLPHGDTLGRVAGGLAVGLALIVLASPTVAARIVPSPGPMPSMMPAHRPGSSMR
jgi:predicted metal-binding membrane protein